jgi:WD40 repeat protein
MLVHTSRIVSAAFSPDGTRVITGSEDATAKLWDVATGRLIRTLDGHADHVTAVAFSGDGTRVLTGSRNGTIKLWYAANGHTILTIELGAVIHGSPQAAFSPDGTSLLTDSGDGPAKLWDAASGRELRTFHHGTAVRAVAFSPDGTRLLTGGDKLAKLWETATGRLLQAFGDGSHQLLTTLAFSPDGTRVVTGGFRTEAKLWDATTGKLIRTLLESHHPRSVAFSPDGSRIMGNTMYGFTTWAAASGQVLDRNSIQGIAASPDGTRILGAGGSSGGFTLLDVNSGQFIEFSEYSTVTVGQIAVSPDGERVVAGLRRGYGWPGAIVQWEGRTGKIVSGRLVKGVNPVALAPDGRFVLSVDRGQPIKLWDAASGKHIRAFEGISRLFSLALSSDGSRLLACCDDSASLLLWDVASGAQLLRTVESGGTTVALSRNNSRIAAGDPNEVVKVWDARTGRLLQTMHPWGWFEGLFRRHRAERPITAVALSPDGSQVLAGREWWGGRRTARPSSSGMLQRAG